MRRTAAPAREGVARPEILKLARLLRCEPQRLAYLEDAPAEDLRMLREQVTELLFTAHEATLKRLAASSRLLPVGLVALIGERAFGPMLAARIAGYLDPERAIEVSARLPAEFLASVAVELDPRRVQAVIAGIPPEQIALVSRQLTARGEYVAMGRFVGHLPPASLRAAVGELSDGDLLRTAFVMEDKQRLEDLADLLGEDRLDGLIEAAQSEQLWTEALDLVSHLSEERRGVLAQRAEALGVPVPGSAQAR